MPITGIDHVIILVEGLAEAMARYEALGFEVEPGGEHPDWGTENALIALADGAYLELLAARDPASAARHRLWRRPDGGTRQPGEYGGFALRSSPIEEDVAAIRARGLLVDGPVPGSRHRPDGQEVRWRMASPAGAELPFLIEDETPRVIRIAPPIGGLGAAAEIDEVACVVADVDAAAGEFERLLGDSATMETREAAGGVVRFQTPAGSVTLHGPGQTDGSLEHFTRAGPGVFAVVLAVYGSAGDQAVAGTAAAAGGRPGAGPEPARLIDPAQTGGVRLSLRFSAASRPSGGPE